MNLNSPQRHSSLHINTQQSVFESIPSPKRVNLNDKLMHDGSIVSETRYASPCERLPHLINDSEQAIDTLHSQHINQDPFFLNGSYSASESSFGISNPNLIHETQLGLDFNNESEFGQCQTKNGIYPRKRLYTPLHRPETSGHQIDLSVHSTSMRQKRTMARYTTDGLDVPKNASDDLHHFNCETINQKGMQSGFFPEFSLLDSYPTPQHFSVLPPFASQSQARYSRTNFPQDETAPFVKDENSSNDEVRQPFFQDKDLFGVETSCNNSFSASNTSSFVGSVSHIRDRDQVVDVAELADQKLPKTVRFAS